MATAERWVTIFERVVHTVYRMKLGQIDYGPRDTSGWLLWRSERMPPTALANRGGYVTVVYVAELSWAESNELIEAVLTCDAETFRGVGPNRMSTMDGAFYVTSEIAKTLKPSLAPSTECWRSGGAQESASIQWSRPCSSRRFEELREVVGEMWSKERRPKRRQRNGSGNRTDERRWMQITSESYGSIPGCGSATAWSG